MSIINQILEAKGLKFTVKALGLKNKDGWERYSFKVTIGSVSIDYGMGIAHAGKTPRPDDVIPCIITDASYGEYGFEDFCSELGYNQYDDESGGYNRLSRKVWEACKAQKVKLELLRFTAEEMEQMQEYIEEQGL